MILSSRGTVRPFRYLWILLGAVSLVAITLGIFLPDWLPVARLGEGGIERWNSYPIVLWLVAYGSYLLASIDTGQDTTANRTGRRSSSVRDPSHQSSPIGMIKARWVVAGCHPVE